MCAFVPIGTCICINPPSPVKFVTSSHGAVVRFALRSAERLGAGARLVITALDGSHSALAELRRRHPGIRCVVADAVRAPFPDGAFDVVTSQFGLEYAGQAALPEAARLVAPGLQESLGQLEPRLGVHGTT